jgi:cyanophycin synthetase
MNLREDEMNKPISVAVPASKTNLEIKIIPGPNLFVPFAAVVAEFAIPTPNIPPSGSTFPEIILARLPEAVVRRIQKLDGSAPFETRVAGLAQALQDWHGHNDLPCQISRASSSRGLVYLGYHDELAAAYALRLSYQLAQVICAERPRPVNANSTLVARLAELGTIMKDRQPHEVDRAIIREARARGIPVYRVVPGNTALLQYGQGKHGRFFSTTSNQCDSHSGTMLQRNKVTSNLLVRRLGFPGVEHGVANTADGAATLANQLGYPVVIKPIDGRQGLGVTAGVTSGEEVAVAFAEANAISPGEVIVERLVEGENVRLAVYGGRFATATIRSPPRLVGDGKHTVTELIELENQRRAEATAEYSKELKIDDVTIAMLQKQNLRLSDRVSAGRVVSLRTVANTSAGGIAVLVTDRVHADNWRMAEAIARCFRLDTVGIDFLTADITKSWREVKCAIIEVNTSPQFSFEDAQAKLVLERAFPCTSAGRISCAVVVCAEPARVKEVVLARRREGVTLGLVERELILLGGEPRAIEHVGLAERVQGLLLDPACEALVVACAPEEIVEQGLPLDHCELCIVDSKVKVSEPLRQLLEQCSDEIIDDVPIETALVRWLEEMVV